MFKKLSIIGTLVLFLVGSMVVGVYADESENDSGSLSYIDIDEDMEIEVDGSSLSRATLSNDDNREYMSDEDDVVEFIRSAMTNREELFTVYYSGSSPNSSVIADWVNKALSKTNSANQGDYLIFNSGGPIDEPVVSYCDVNKYKIDFSWGYYTNNVQEKEVDKEVSNIVSKLGLRGNISDYEKVKRVYNYFTSNTDCDYDNYDDNSYTLKYTAYAALIDKKAVCQGFSNAMYRILNDVGVDTRIVVNTKHSHSWCIVKIGSKYYNVDVLSDLYSSEYNYFLKGGYSFNGNSMDMDYFNEYIGSKYVISSKDYFSVNLSAVGSISASLDGAHNKVKVTWSKVSGASGYYVYYKKEGSSSYTKMSTTSSTSASKSGLSEDKKYTFKVLPYFKDGKVVGCKSDGYKTASIYTRKGIKAPTSVKTSLYGYDDIQVTWSKVSGASGYCVYYKKSTASKYAYLGKTTGYSYKKANLGDGLKYDFKIVPYYMRGSDKVEGYYGKTSSIYTLKKVSGIKVYSKSGKVRVRWINDINEESGYQISQYYKKTKTNVVMTYKTSKGTFRDLKVKKNKKYYYKVRAFKDEGGKRIYGPWSNLAGYTLN